jgi:hypothetical protein
MRDHATPRPLPAEQSILWKPLYDSHYVVASLQPGDGGRRKIFVQQQVLARVQALVRSSGRRTVGLLLGHFYECPRSGADYLVIDECQAQKSVGDETEIVAAIAEALADRSAEQRPPHPSMERSQVIGWFRGVAVVEAKPSLTTAAAHSSLFGQPWQITLVVSERADSSGGAIFLHDTSNSRWFYAPFYELLPETPAADRPKLTVLSWPQYLTADTVADAGPDVMAAAEAKPTAAPYERPSSAPEPTVEVVVEDRPVVAMADLALPTSELESSTMAALGTATASTPQPLAGMPVQDAEQAPESSAANDRVAADRPVPIPPATLSVHSGLADVSRGFRERPRRGERSTGKLSIVDDHDQRSMPSSARRVGDNEDTSTGDDPGRYIEMARTEGFFIAARFDSNVTGRAETLWILNEPYSGLLLAVGATESEVLDATLHYNVQTDDVGLRRTPFPEHRDPVSKTIYVRETCMEALRARCQRLRASNTLVREWKVTPTIPFLTPGEWESIAAMDRRVGGVADITNARLAELPAGLQSQFHLGGVSEMAIALDVADDTADTASDAGRAGSIPAPRAAMDRGPNADA